MKLKQRYQLNKDSKVGESCICPSCGTEFKKVNHQQAFCRTKGGTICKENYLNILTPEKRNNTTRISPASARWMEKQKEYYKDFNPDDYEHPFSSEGLGQWE